MLLNDFLLRSVIHTPNKIAVLSHTTGEALTYQETNDRAIRLSNALISIGVQKDDRLAIAQYNSLEYIITFFAAVKIGAVVVPIDYRITPREFSYQLNDSGATVIFIGSDFVDSLQSVCATSPALKHCIYINNDNIHRLVPDFKEFYSSHPNTPPDVSIDEGDLATLHYTSGTTSRPKGVMMTHRNLVSGMKTMLGALPVTSEDATLHTSPFSHIASEWPLLTHFYVGGMNVIVTRPDIDSILSAIQNYQVTTWNTVPTLIQKVLGHPFLTEYNLRSLRWVAYGASPMPIEVIKKAISEIGDVFVQVYGLTETYILTLLPKEDHVVVGPASAIRKLSSCGKALPGCLVRVVDSMGKDTNIGDTGEIIASGTSVTKGYWNMPEETANVIKSGWFYTGDLATIDEEGYIYIVDRKKEIIISGGENVSPREVEEVIYSHPAVFEVAVIGIPDKKWGEAVKAIIVPKENQVIDTDDITVLCKKNLAGYKVPKSIEIIASLPKTTSGKIAKRELKDKYYN